MRRRDEKFPDNGFEAWGGYMQAKIAKLEQQYTSRAGDESKESDIFNGVSIFVNGFTIPSADELKALMAKHGGVYHTYQRKEDYIIASNLPDTKVKKMSLSRIVKPEWITHSIASSRLLDYRDYLLYKNSKTQPQLNFAKIKDEKCKSETHTPETFNETEISEYKLLKTDKLSNDMDTNKELKISKIPIVENKGISPLKEPTVSFSSNSIYQDGDLKNVKKENVTKTAADPNFISEFYNNSRLHHISQLGALFKQHVNDLREHSNLTFPARSELKEKISTFGETSNLSPPIFEKGKTIMHIDMDCFFVSVGLRNRPELRGKPVAVTHSKGGQGRAKRPGVDRNAEFNLYRQKQAKKIGKAIGKPEDEIEFESRVDNIADEDEKFGSMSEIASCSYEARAKGISNGMFMGAALRLCPDLQTIPYDFDGYKEVAFNLYNTIAQYTLDIEAVSCDEMYVDCSDILKELGVSVQDFASVLRAEIKRKTGCPCSTGFGGNRLQARLATKRAKPDGQFFLTAELVEDFIFDIKLKDLPGVGRQTMQKLESLGHETCGSLQSLPLVTLQKHLGNKTGSQLFDQCRGRDGNPLSFITVRKSVSAEVNYGIRFENNDQCVEFLKQLSAEVHSRMQQFKVLGKCITLKLMVRAEEAPVETAKFMGHGFCDVVNKSTTLSNATNDVEIITKEVISLCKKQGIDPKEMRGIGIQVTKLETMNSNKHSKGAISKFLSNTKVKTEVKSEPESDPVLSYNNPVNNLRPQTPIKVATSPKDKSPILGLMKSPTGKRRGRPPKCAKPLQSISKNLMSRFLHGQNTAIKDTPYKSPMIKEVSVSKEVVKREHKQEGLLGLPWEKVRELLRAWLQSGQAPLPCDVEMISAYMTEMVINKNIDKLQILLNFLRRRTIEMGCENWINVNKHVVEEVQNAMIAVYGKKLYIGN